MNADKKYFSVYIMKPTEVIEFAQSLKEIPGVLESKLSSHEDGRYSFDVIIDAHAGIEEEILAKTISHLNMSELGHITTQLQG